MKAYLHQAIQTLLSKHENLQEVTIVLPSKRAGVFLQDYLIQEIETAQFAPEIFSIESFIEHLSSLKKANQTHQLFQLYLAYKKNIPEEYQDDFSIFMQWGTRLLKDFNDIDAYRVKAKDALENLGEFYQLEGFNILENKQSFPAIFWKNLYLIYQDFQALLMGQQSATLGMLYQDALDGLEIYLAHTSKMHYFIGFNALNKAEQDLIQEFLAKNKGEVLWDLDAYFYENKLHAAGRFIRSYQNKWTYYRQNPQAFIENNFLTKKNIQSIGFSGNIDQAQFVHQFLQEYKDQPGSTAVVLGNEALLLPVLSSLPEDVSQWNVTMGYAIQQLPITSFFTTIIELHANSIDKAMTRKVCIELLSFPPLVKLMSKESENLKVLVSKIQENFDNWLTIEELLPLLESKYAKLIFGPVEGDTSLFIDQLISLVVLFEEYFFRQKEHLSSVVMGLIKKVLFQLKIQIDSVNFPIDLSVITLLFQEGVSMQTIDFSGDPIQGIQIMGMLETRALDFDHVIITNVNEGILPVGKNDQSFFPFAMKKQFGLPTFLDNDAIYTYHFYRLLQRAKNIYLLYNSKSEGLGAGEKSRFIRQLAFSNFPQHQFSDRLFNANIIPPEEKLISIPKTSLMLEQLKQLASGGFSPTSLGAYLYDPIAFYHRYLLKIKEDTTMTKTLSNLKRGTLVHDCLEALYLPYKGQPMQLDQYDEMLDKLPGFILDQYQKIYPKMPHPKGENYLILKAYERSIKQLLTQEKELVKQGNEIIILDLELSFKEALRKDTFSHEVNLLGKIDRVDQYNGVTRLIDYKTGEVKSSNLHWSNWEGFIGDYKKQPLFQLLLYAWVYTSSQGVEVGIISLKKPKQYVLPLKRKDLPKQANTAQVDQEFKKVIEDYLVSLVREIFDEKKSFVSLEQEKV